MKILGLDLGIASVGACLIDTDQQKVIHASVRVFTKAEHPKDGASLAAPRREARSARRRLNRKRRRLNGIITILKTYELPTDHIQKPHNKGSHFSPWQLRKQALHRKLNEKEWARTLYHMAKHRGYQSTARVNQEEQSGNTDGKAMLSGIANLRKKAEQGGYATTASYLADQDHQRNHAGKYDYTLMRTDVRSEADLLFEKQRDFGNPFTDPQMLEKFKACAFTQRPLKSFASKIGKCSIFPEEDRAARYALIAEQFIIWQRLNNLKVYCGKDFFSLNEQEKQEIYNVLLKIKSPLKFAKLRKILQPNYAEEITEFNLCSYYVPRKKGEDPLSLEEIQEKAEKKDFLQFKSYHDLKQVLVKDSPVMGEHGFKTFIEDTRLMADIAHIISFYPDRKEARGKLKELALDGAVIEALLTLPDWKGTIGHSVKALLQIVPLLAEGGLTYDKAMQELGWWQKVETDNKKLLPPFEPIPNPVVNRAASQARKVINAYIRKYDKPDAVHLEVATDFGKSHANRQKDKRLLDGHRAYLDDLKEQIKQRRGFEPNATQLKRYRLWEEQKGYCLYSGKYIHADDIFDETACQIDHAMPFSRSFDNSWRNLVLVKTRENQEKGNRTIYEYLGDNEDRWNKFMALSEALRPSKARHLRMKSYKEDDFKQRSLNDTRYMARFVKEHISRHLSGDNEQFVQVRPGRLTDFLRHHWGLGDKDRAQHFHHAVDAAIVAASNMSTVQQAARHLKGYRRNKEVKDNLPWQSFRDDVLVSVGEIFVSHMPQRKHSGVLHKDTIKGLKTDQDGNKWQMQRKKIQDLKLKDLENMVDKDRNMAVYHAVKQWLGQDPKIREPYPKMSLSLEKIRQGQKPHLIKSIKIQKEDTGGVEIRGGIADRGSMIYVDVYQHKQNKKYFLVPVYTHQWAKGEKPKQAIVAYKPESQWPIMDENYRLLFNLYPNDYVKLRTAKDEIIEGYYIKAGRTTGSFTIQSHDGEKEYPSIGVKTLKSLKKYHIGILGEQSEINIKEDKHELESIDHLTTIET